MAVAQYNEYSIVNTIAFHTESIQETTKLKKEHFGTKNTTYHQDNVVSC